MTIISHFKIEVMHQIMDTFPFSK